MKKCSRFLVLVSILIFSIAFVGCTGDKSPVAEEKKPVSLTVSAAASLTDVLEEIKREYEQENENVSITLNLGSSGSLQQQIEQGAPADVFISAAAKQMDALQEKDLILKETRINLLENAIVLVVPEKSDRVHSFEELKLNEIKKIGLGEPDSVPAGKYGKEVLTHLNLWDQLEFKMVYAKDVRQVLTWVQTESVDAGIVYLTDAKVMDKVKIIAHAPEGSHSPVIYPAAVIKETQEVEAAQEFVNYLQEETARQIFEKYGFSMAK